MQPSIDQKIQAAIQPLIDRISALQAENQKFKQQIASLQTATQPKTAHKPTGKPTVDPIQRPQTTKGGRKKSADNHEVKPDARTDKKPAPKKQEVKGQGQQVKPQGTKPVGPKTPVIGNKNVNSPNTTKDPANPKDIKTKPTTGTGNRASTTNLNNKSIIGEKKPAKGHENEEKKEGQQGGQQKKEHASHQKTEHIKPTSVHNPKTPVINKSKPGQKVDPKKPVNPPVTGTGAKKGGKPPVNDNKKKVDAKPQAPKEQQKQGAEQIKQEHKEAQVKEQHNEEIKTQEVKGQVGGQHNEHHEQGHAQQQVVKQHVEQSPKQHAEQDEAL